MQIGLQLDERFEQGTEARPGLGWKSTITRLLAYVLDNFGLLFGVTPPCFVMRQFVKLTVLAPERPSFSFVGVAADFSERLYSSPFVAAHP